MPCGRREFDLGLGRSLEEGKATHFSILVWRIPWTEEPVRLQSIGLQRVRHSMTKHSPAHPVRVKRVESSRLWEIRLKVGTGWARDQFLS